MNILETLNTELKNKNWTIEQKIRYIYLRCCTLFHYDPTYYILKNQENKKDEVEAIINKKIDPQNVEDFNCVCKNLAIDVFPILLNELLNVYCDITAQNGHYYNIAEVNNKKIKLDATTGDLSYVKMNATTIGYHPINNLSSIINYIRAQDAVINYLQSDYYDYRLQKKAELLNSFYQTHNHKKQGILLEKFLNIQKEFTTLNLDNYSDASKCLEKIKIIFLNVIDNFNTKSQLFYEENQNNWQFVKVYSFLCDSYPIYFTLEKQQGFYIFHESDKSDVKQYMKQMKSTTAKINLHK